MKTDSTVESEKRTTWHITLFGTLLAVMAVICGSIIQTTVANPWLNVTLVFALLLPVLRGEVRQQTSWMRRYQESYCQALIAAGLGWALITAVCYLIKIRPYVGDVDLFYYLCNARDMNNQSLVSDNCYSYFPGVYLFWRTVIGTVGERLAAIQCTYLLVIVCNILLVAGIVWQHSRSLAASLFSGIWFLTLISRFQATAAETELLATIPLLIALFCWFGRPLRGRRGWVSSLLLGTGLGLAVYTKQQAGLLAIGALALLLAYRWRDKEDQHQWRQLIAIPIISVVVLSIGLLILGEGWKPLQIGLSTVGNYASEGSWWSNLYVQCRRDETAALAALLSGLLLAVWFWHKKDHSSESRRRLDVILFLAIGALSTLWQLRTRAYHHYMLLAAPALVIAAVLLWLEFLPARDAQRRSRGMIRSLFILLAFLPFLRDAGIRESFTAWRIPQSSNFAPPCLWHQQSPVAEDLVQLQKELPSQAKLYAVPPRHNSIYWTMQAHSSSPLGYSFEQPLETTDWSRHPRVLLLKPAAWDQSDSDFMSGNKITFMELRNQLIDLGFQERLELDTMTLFEQVP